MYKHLLLDLDGTLTDPKTGITRCVEYALNSFGIQVDDPDELIPFIGPPLIDSFQEFYHFTPEQAAQAAEKYRERFTDTGIYENKIFEEIPTFLEKACTKGYKLYLATSKPIVFAERIMDYFHLRDYFSFLGGTEPDVNRLNKTDVIKHVLSENHMEDLNRVVMIGDRKHDIEGARNTGIDSIGVLYGYGDYKELKEAGADYIVKDVRELSELLRL